MSFVKGIFLGMMIILVTSSYGLAANLRDMPAGKLVDADELSPLFLNNQWGDLFTVNAIPVPLDDMTHPIPEVHSNVACSFNFKSKTIPLSAGNGFVAKEAKRKISEKGGKSYLTVMLKLVRLGTDGSQENDRVIYSCTYDVSSNRMYDENQFLDALNLYFHSVARQKKYHRPYAGQGDPSIDDHR